MHLVHADSYERAWELMKVVTRLWDSGEDDAVVVDVVSGLCTDVRKIYEINYFRTYFNSPGPLNTSRTLQVPQIYVQAGASDDGRAFDPQFTGAIFTATRPWFTRRPSKPTSNPAPAASGAIRTISPSIPASAPRSAPPTTERAGCMRS